MLASQRKKASPKEPLPVTERIRKHFKSLVGQVDGGHLKNAIKTCDKILRLDPNDPDALRAKLALLLHTDQHALALGLSETLLEGMEPNTFPLVFEKAYALYRLNREPQAHDVIQTIKPNGETEERGLMHLEAQIEYRRGNYKQAQDLYSKIFDSSPLHSDEQSDSLTNLKASQTHLEFLRAGFLRSLHTLPQSLINSLEDAPPPPFLSSHPVLATASAQQQRQPTPNSEKKKVRGSRVPKGVVPGVTPPPDPERWLKKSERTIMHYHTAKRKKGVTSGATQGSLVEGGSKGGKGKKKR